MTVCNIDILTLLAYKWFQSIGQRKVLREFLCKPNDCVVVRKAALLFIGFGGQPFPQGDENIFKTNPLLGSSRNEQISVSMCTHIY